MAAAARFQGATGMAGVADRGRPPGRVPRQLRLARLRPVQQFVPHGQAGTGAARRHGGERELAAAPGFHAAGRGGRARLVERRQHGAGRGGARRHAAGRGAGLHRLLPGLPRLRGAPGLGALGAAADPDGRRRRLDASRTLPRAGRAVPGADQADRLSRRLSRLRRPGLPDPRPRTASPSPPATASPMPAPTPRPARTRSRKPWRS